MHDAPHTLLASLQAALCARAVYGDDHASYAQQCRAAAAACAACGAGAFMFVGGKAVWNDVAMGTRREEYEQFAARMSAHDADVLGIGAAATAEQVAALINHLASPPGTQRPALEAFTLGRAHAMTGGSADTPQGPNAAAMAGDLHSLWGGLLQPESMGEATPQANHLSALIANISASVATSRTSILRLAAVKDMDEYTFVHTVNVSIQAGALAEAVGLSPAHVHGVIEAGLLHDIGKAAVPEHILNKNGMLSDEERAVVQRHPVEGAAMLLERKHPNPIATIVALEHHMHIDGTGYPAPRRGQRPHLASQIVQVADVFDALRTNRPYRAALLHDVAMETMWKSAGSKFDTDLLTAFFTHVAQRAPAPAAA